MEQVRDSRLGQGCPADLYGMCFMRVVLSNAVRAICWGQPCARYALLRRLLRCGRDCCRLEGTTRPQLFDLDCQRVLLMTDRAVSRSSAGEAAARHLVSGNQGAARRRQAAVRLQANPVTGGTTAVAQPQAAHAALHAAGRLCTAACPRSSGRGLCLLTNLGSLPRPAAAPYA